MQWDRGAVRHGSREAGTPAGQVTRGADELAGWGPGAGDERAGRARRQV